MRSIIQKLSLAAATVLAGLNILIVAPAFAQPTLPANVGASSVNDACKGIGLTGSGCGGSSATNKLEKVVKVVIQLLSIAVGIAAVIMIIISGMRYITSGGDPQKVAGAKSALIYAIIGLIIAALAQVIVHFVLGRIK